jgi:amidase
LARTVADAAALLDVMAGYVVGDPYWLPDPPTSFLEHTQQAPPSLRVAVATEIEGWTVDAQCQDAASRIARQLEALGHTIAPGCPDFRPIAEPFEIIYKAAIAATGVPPEMLSPMNRWFVEQAGTLPEVLQALGTVKAQARKVVAFFEDWDVLVLPTFAHPIVKVGEWDDLSPSETFEAMGRWVFPCPPFNASGQPSIAVPAGFDDRGLPLSVQIVGKPAAEGLLLQLAAQLERDGAWHPCRPPESWR